MNREHNLREAKSAPITVLMLLTNAYDPDPRVRQEALALIAMGCHVHLVAWDRDAKSAPRERIEGVEVERIFLPSTHGRGNAQLFFYLWLYLKMLWRTWRIRFDAIHCHDLDTLPIGFVVGKLKSKPIVYDSHESFPDMLEGTIHPFLKTWLIRLENFLIRRIDLLITVGETLRRHFEERGARRLVVVGNWKQLRDYSRNDQENLEVRRRLRIPEGAMTVVCITQLLKNRKLEELLQAVEECRDVYLLIGGNGSLEGVVRDHASKNRRVIYLGFVPASKVPEYTCAADVVYYGFDPANPNARFSAPNKLFEALAAGRPLITGDFGEVGDLVRRFGCGIVLPAYSPASIRQALEALREPDLWKKLASNAELLGRTEMNWGKCEEVLYRAYAALLRSERETWRFGDVPEATLSDREEALTAVRTEHQR